MNLLNLISYFLCKGTPHMFPQRQAAISSVTLLTYEAFNKILTPIPTLINSPQTHLGSGQPHPPSGPTISLSPLEKFLGCFMIRKHLQTFIQSNEVSTIVQYIIHGNTCSSISNSVTFLELLALFSTILGGGGSRWKTGPL